MRFSLLRISRAVALLGTLAVAPSAMAQSPVFNEQQKQAIGEVVKEYLLKNPEVITEVIAELEKRQAEARLSQMEVDYDDPLDFLDKCIVVASTLLYLHRRFSFEQRKNLLRAVFERIEVEDRAIVSVKLNPPFSILMRDDLGRLFKDCPPAGTTQYLARALRALASRFSVQKRPIFLFLLLAESQKQTFSEYLVSNIKRRFS